MPESSMYPRGIVRGPLASTSDLGVARRLISSFDAFDDMGRESKDQPLAFINSQPNAHMRSCAPGHLTGSAFVLEHNKRRALLTYHKQLRRWLQLGGHADGDANLTGVALRESREECGLSDLSIDPTLIDIDIHKIPAHRGVREHLHFDVCFWCKQDRSRCRPSAMSRLSCDGSV